MASSASIQRGRVEGRGASWPMNGSSASTSLQIHSSVRHSSICVPRLLCQLLKRSSAGLKVPEGALCTAVLLAGLSDTHPWLLKP